MAKRIKTSRTLGAALLIVTTMMGAVLVSALPGSAANGDVYAVRVTVENLAPEGGTFQTPVWAALHDGSFDTYDAGEPISAELERLAEDGTTGPISAAFADSGAGSDTTIVGPNGPIFSGDSASHLFLTTADAPYFSYASMVIPSNDAFVSNGDPMEHLIFDGDGNVVTSEIIVAGSEVLDAGSEVNDEIPEHTAALAQAAPDTGETEGGVIGPHPGFIPEGNILAAIPNGDFTQEGYETLRITFEVSKVDTSPRTIHSVLEGFDENPSVDTSAVGYANFRLRGGVNRVELTSQFWNIENVVAAHLHLGARDENGPVVVNLARLAGGDDLDDGVDGVVFRQSQLTGPLEGMPLEALIAEIEAGNIYINVHTMANPSGEMRGQLQPTP